MTDIEQAFRILDLKPGANVKEIVEARDDLLVLWDPNRLKSHPRLRSKAAVKIREIHGAYQVLMQHPGQEEARAGADASAARGPSPVSEAGPGPSADAPLPPAGGTASLFDEVFRDRKNEKRRRLPMAPILAGVVVVLSAALVLLLIGGGEAPTEPAPAAVTDPAPEPPVPPEPDSPGVESAAETSSVPEPAQEVESGASKPPGVAAPPPQREIDTPPKAPAPTPPEPVVASTPKPQKPKTERPHRPGGRPVLVREPGGAKSATAGTPPAPDPKAAEKEAERKEAEKTPIGRGREGLPGPVVWFQGGAAAGG